MATARYSPFVCPFCARVWEQGSRRSPAGPEGCGVGRGHTPVLLGAGDVGAGLLGALLSQTQPPEGSSPGSLERSSKKNK